MDAEWREGAGREVWEAMCLGERGVVRLLKGMRGCMSILSGKSLRLEQVFSPSCWEEGCSGSGIPGRMQSLRAWVRDRRSHADERPGQAR
jgi:hypothetical protein